VTDDAKMAARWAEIILLALCVALIPISVRAQGSAAAPPADFARKYFRSAAGQFRRAGFRLPTIRQEQERKDA
jgi:hypothetical protein